MQEELKNLVRLQLTEDRISDASKARDQLAIDVQNQAVSIRELTKKRNDVQDLFDIATNIIEEAAVEQASITLGSNVVGDVEDRPNYWGSSRCGAHSWLAGWLSRHRGAS